MSIADAGGAEGTYGGGNAEQGERDSNQQNEIPQHTMAAADAMPTEGTAFCSKVGINEKKKYSIKFLELRDMLDQNLSPNARARSMLLVLKSAELSTLRRKVRDAARHKI